MAPPEFDDDPFKQAVPDIDNDIDMLSNLDPKHEIKSDFGDLQIREQKSSLNIK